MACVTESVAIEAASLILTLPDYCCVMSDFAAQGEWMTYISGKQALCRRGRLWAHLLTSWGMTSNFEALKPIHGNTCLQPSFLEPRGLLGSVLTLSKTTVGAVYYPVC